jgi:sporulation protein YlmC with PRC-barrel domain
VNRVRISELIGKPVIEQDHGRRIGRAWDVRVRREHKSRSATGEERWIVDSLVISRTGALERFGFFQIKRNSPPGSWQAPRDVIAWDRIVTIGPDAITVRAEAANGD